MAPIVLSPNRRIAALRVRPGCFDHDSNSLMIELASFRSFMSLASVASLMYLLATSAFSVPLLK